MTDLYFSENGFKPVTYIDLVESQVQLEDETTQLKILEFTDRLQRCDSCSESWNRGATLQFWLYRYYDFVDGGNCPYQSDGLHPFRRTVQPQVFYPCLKVYQRYLEEKLDKGEALMFESDVIWEYEEADETGGRGRIQAFKFEV